MHIVGIFRFVISTNKFCRTESLQINVLLCIICDKGGYIWIINSKEFSLFGGFIIFALIIGVTFSLPDGIKPSSANSLLINNIEPKQSNNIFEYTDNSSEENTICVYVIGAVKTPGIVILKENSRLYEAIEKAGGFSGDANKNEINLAQILEDGEKIIIPFSEQPKNDIAKDINNMFYNFKNEQNQKININTATKKELETLNGIGDAMSQRIIDYRNSVSSFKKIEDIKKVSGIGESKFEKIKNDITV